MPRDDGYAQTEDGIQLFYQTAGHGPAILVPNGIPLMDDLTGGLPGRTVIGYDSRNRGRSSATTDPQVLARGIQNDVDDLDAVRRHFGYRRATIVGHSYVAVVAALYALQNPEGVARFVQIGPPPPEPSAQYPDRLHHRDRTTTDVMTALGALEAERASHTPEEFCLRFWRALRPLFVTRAEDADRVRWGRCDLANERAFRRHWIEHLMPSLRAFDLSAAVLARVRTPVLVVHGRLDRSAPYGGGRDWALRLANARLITVDTGGHAPWIEAPGLVFPSLSTFLDGEWPAAAERVVALDADG